MKLIYHVIEFIYQFSCNMIQLCKYMNLSSSIKLCSESQSLLIVGYIYLIANIDSLYIAYIFNSNYKTYYFLLNLICYIKWIISEV